MKHILGVVMFCASLTMDHQRNSVEASPKADGATSHPQGKDATLQWFFRKLGKRGNVLDKCAPQSACALLQAPADASSFYVDEICYCGDGGKCSLEWDESGTDERSVNNADTQLKLCQPITKFPVCTHEQTAVTTGMETSVANPTIKQSAWVFCNCPRKSHEHKLIDASMVDEGDRTVVTAQFGCALVEHCRPKQPCKFLALLPTGDTLAHQSCECNEDEVCPRESNPDGITPAFLDEITYYPFTCRSKEIKSNTTKKLK